MSSLTVGLVLAAGNPTLAFLLPAGVGVLGVGWMVVLVARGTVR